jgi:hypothetical protein
MESSPTTSRVDLLTNGAQTLTSLQGKIVHGGTFMATKKKAKKKKH